MGGGFADGVTLPEDKVPRKIKVELVSISDTKLVAGTEATATVKLQNAGSKSIEIPWSTDARTAQDGQDSGKRAWEVGFFEISVGDKKNRFNELVNTSQLLYGSRFVPGSILTIKPGEWITAQTSFRVALQHPEYEDLPEGSSDLAVEWVQSARTRSVRDCNVILGFFPYDSFYEHPNRVTVLKVKIVH